jgi:hypothetical protein
MNFEEHTKQLKEFLTPGSIFKLKRSLTFWDLKFLENSELIHMHITLDKGAIVTFVDFITITDQRYRTLSHPVFLINGRKFIGSGGITESPNFCQERLSKIV